MNACEKQQSTKRGKFVFKTFSELRDQFGDAIAKDIRQRKQELEKNRLPGEEPYWCEHPEVKNNEARLPISIDNYMHACIKN